MRYHVTKMLYLNSLICQRYYSFRREFTGYYSLALNCQVVAGYDVTCRRVGGLLELFFDGVYDLKSETLTPFLRIFLPSIFKGFSASEMADFTFLFSNLVE